MSTNETINMDKYYNNKELADGVDGLPPINEVTLRNLRFHRKIRYTKLGRQCIYKRAWILEYLERNEVASYRPRK